MSRPASTIPRPLCVFSRRLSYVPLDATRPEGFKRLAEEVESGRRARDLPVYRPVAVQADDRRIAFGGADAVRVSDWRWKSRSAPISTSSREINDAVAAAFPEERTFRIDHYLGKETVQNLLALRFANSAFEPLWNSAHIDHVQITVAETVGLEGRGDYYDGAGALRDMVQNHMLQLLALVAMEPPADFDATAVRDEKVKVLRSLRPMTAADVSTNVVTGQYAQGRGRQASRSRPMPTSWARNRDTETFVALKAHVENWRWAGVPFYLRTGKRMAERQDRDLHPVQMRAALDLRQPRSEDPGQQAAHFHPAGREYPPAGDGQDAGP